MTRHKWKVIEHIGYATGIGTNRIYGCEICGSEVTVRPNARLSDSVRIWKIPGDCRLSLMKSVLET